ncbi:MAG: domain S-box protein [Segetibacter sp.]|nr:domain S-box protein [Segetibacter sp.]
MSELRKSGIDVLGDIPWGLHVCQFYETKKDLLDLLIPYFKAGLENNEFCLWITCNPLTKENALEELRKSIPNFDHFLAKQNIEILHHVEWYLKGGKFNANEIIKGWDKKLQTALAKGYEGMRVNGNETWLEQEDWEDFMKYETELNNTLHGQRMIVLCTYPLSKTSAASILDVAHSHERAISKRKGHWEILEDPEIKEIKEELKNKNYELEQKVIERTRQLKFTNRELLNEISERKKAEDALRKSQDSIRLIIDTIPVMTWTLGADGNVDFLNQRWLDYTGISMEEEIENPMGIVHPEDRTGVIEKLSATLVAGKPSEYEMRLRRADGEYRWFLLRAAPLRDELGSVVKWYGVCFDIEDKKRAENELQLTYQRLSYHVENTPLAVIEWDKDLFIKRWSTHAEEIFGWTASEALGKNMYDPAFSIIYKEDVPEVNIIAEQLIKGIVDRNLSLNRNYTKDGNVIYCEWYNSVLRDEQGNAITILSLIHNVTERKKTEETLQQSYEEIRRLTEHLQKIREEERIHIAREIHDELGQQLTAIKMDVAWIDKKTPVETTDIKRKLKNIIGLLDGSNQSIRRILSELRPRILDDHGLLEAVEWLSRQFSATTGIPVKCTTPEKDIKVQEQIATCLFRVCQEALTNITRYALAKNVSISISIIEKDIILIIEDDGIGFDAASVQNKKSFGILGMKERVLSLRGKFELVSLPGKGTKITVSLPL